MNQGLLKFLGVNRVNEFAIYLYMKHWGGFFLNKFKVKSEKHNFCILFAKTSLIYKY